MSITKYVPFLICTECTYRLLCYVIPLCYYLASAATVEVTYMYYTTVVYILYIINVPDLLVHTKNIKIKFSM